MAFAYTFVFNTFVRKLVRKSKLDSRQKQKKQTQISTIFLCTQNAEPKNWTGLEMGLDLAGTGLGLSTESEPNQNK